MTEPVGICYLAGQSCDVMQQTGCDAGEACYLAPLPDCRPPGALAVGDACRYLDDCAPGSECMLGPDGGVSCQRFCASDADCEGDERCDHVPERDWVARYGVCR